MKVKNRSLLFLGITAGLSLLLAVLRSVALCTAMDGAIGYFRTGAALPVILYIMEGICAVAAFSPLFFLPRETRAGDASLSSLFSLAGSGVAALAFLAVPIFLIKERAALGASGALLIFTVLFFFVAAGYFGLQWASPKKRVVPLFFCGCGLILAAVLAFILLYFDRFTPMNAPHKRALHLGLLALMLAALFALRKLVGKDLPRAAFSVSLLSFGVAFTVGVSDTAAFLAGVYTSPAYLALDLLLVAFSLYLATNTPIPEKE